MYEWSKIIIKKISDANCLDLKELRMVEVILRTHEVYEDIMNECIGISENNKYELEYGMVRKEKKYETLQSYKCKNKTD